VQLVNVLIGQIRPTTAEFFVGRLQLLAGLNAEDLRDNVYAWIDALRDVVRPSRDFTQV
jgi:hypothetical protein